MRLSSTDIQVAAFAAGMVVVAFLLVLLSRRSVARRLATLESIADVEVLAIDADVAAEWARLRVHLAASGRRVTANDLWIAATAAAHGMPVINQDDDFGPLDGVSGLRVIRV